MFLIRLIEKYLASFELVDPAVKSHITPIQSPCNRRISAETLQLHENIDLYSCGEQCLRVCDVGVVLLDNARPLIQPGQTAN